jgi:hypothetical protein
MRYPLENRLVCALVSLLFVLAVGVNISTVGSQLILINSITITPDTWNLLQKSLDDTPNNISHGPTLPPEPIENRIAHGPTLPPEPVESRIAHGPTLPSRTVGESYCACSHYST